MNTPASGSKLLWLAWVAACVLTGCTATRFVYSPAEIRELVTRRVPGLTTEGVVVPYEVLPEHIARAREFVRMCPTDAAKADALAKALFDPEGFGLTYQREATGTAIETLEKKSGNCLSIASVYIGLARALGLTAYYLDFSHRIQETHQLADLTVHTGHVTAVVDVGNDKKALDLGIQFRRLPVFRYVSDLEIVAHYYNNLGYAVIHQAEVDNRPVAWLEVARLFRIAVHVVPHFARAWNNLGVAYSRLGRTTQAMACYRQAIRSDPQMVSAFSNLGVLFLSEERFAEAIAVLEQAIALNPDQESLRERLGKACHRLGRVSSPSPIDICPIPR